MELQITEQQPDSNGRTGPVEQLMDYFLVPGGRIGLWCAASGATGGCEFDDLVVVNDDFRFSLSGPVDCNACNLNWFVGDDPWCRCCAQDCAPFDRAACISVNGFCARTCTTSNYCKATTIANTTRT